MGESTKVYTRSQFSSTLRQVIQSFNRDIPIVNDGVNDNIFSVDDTYGVVSILSESRGASNVFEIDGDYNANYVNRSCHVQLRLISPDAETMADVIDQLYTHLESTELRYACTRHNINIVKDYDIKTYKDTSPYDGSIHVSVTIFDFTVTYVNKITDYVGVIKDATLEFGLEDGGVYIHENIEIPPKQKS